MLLLQLASPGVLLSVSEDVSSLVLLSSIIFFRMSLIVRSFPLSDISNEVILVLRMDSGMSMEESSSFSNPFSWEGLADSLSELAGLELSSWF